jgi:hypothetical protein
MTMRFRVYAMASNAQVLDADLARKKGIDDFVDAPMGTLLDIDGVPTARIRQIVGSELRARIEDAKRSGADRVYLTLGHRSAWTNLDLDAVDNGIIDGASALIPHAIDWAYTPPAV